jgi:MFS family permease
MDFKQNKEQQKRDLKYSILDGINWAVMYYLLTVFLTPYIIFLGANSLEVGLIEGLPIFVASFFSLIAFSILRKFNSKKALVVFFCLIQATVCILFAVSYYFFENILLIWIIIFLFIIFNISVSISHTIYTDWISHIFNLKKIGSFQSKKDLFIQLFSIVPLVLGGLLLDILGTSAFNEKVYLGFTIIFIVAGLFRYISTYFLNKMNQTEDREDIKKEEDKYNKPILSVFKKEILKDHSFRYFLIVIVFIFFSLYISAPFNKYYLIKILSFSYTKYILLNIFSIIGMALSLLYWGVICDQYGSKKILKSTLLFIAFFPLFLIVFSKSFILLSLLFFFDGMVYSGFVIAIKNYFYQNIKEDLIHHVSFFNIFQSFAIFAATMFGSFIIIEFTKIFVFEKYALWMVFIIGSLIRFISYLFAKNIKDQKRRPINLIKNILKYMPLRYGLNKLNHFVIREEKLLLHKIITNEKKAQKYIHTKIQFNKTLKNKIRKKQTKNK